MATITLKYDARNAVAKKTLHYILSIGFNEVKPKKTGLEEAFEDVEAGRVTRIYTPKNLSIQEHIRTCFKSGYGFRVVLQ